MIEKITELPVTTDNEGELQQGNYQRGIAKQGKNFQGTVTGYSEFPGNN